MPDTTPSSPDPNATRPRRLAWIDWFRGVLMVHMALDHVSMTFNRARWANEVAWRMPPIPDDLGQFLTRFSGVFVAPGFSFIAGFMVWWTSARRRAAGVSDWTITRRLVFRGLVLIALEQIGSRLMFGDGLIIVMVLSSLGTCLILLAFLRFLPTIVVAALALAVFVVHPLIELRALVPEESLLADALAVVLWDAGGCGGPWGVWVEAMYPIVPWIGIMLAGYVAAAWTMRDVDPPVDTTDESTAAPATATPNTIRRWIIASAASFALFFAIRIPADYGSAYWHDGIGTLSFWIFAKYPPDLCWITWSFGWIFGLLAFLEWLASGPKIDARWLWPLTIIGRVPFFFYIAHFVVIGVASKLLREHAGRWPLGHVYLAWLVLLAVMIPPCLAWWRFRRG